MIEIDFIPERLILVNGEQVDAKLRVKCEEGIEEIRLTIPNKVRLFVHGDKEYEGIFVKKCGERDVVDVSMTFVYDVGLDVPSMLQDEVVVIVRGNWGDVKKVVPVFMYL
jgi:hypothetical protein